MSGDYETIDEHYYVNSKENLLAEELEEEIGILIARDALKVNFEKKEGGKAELSF